MIKMQMMECIILVDGHGRELISLLLVEQGTGQVASPYVQNRGDGFGCYW